MDLILRLNQSVLDREQQPGGGQRATAFDDLAGQIRASLDQFQIRRPFSFSLLSLTMMGLILLIGPIDYLLINRVFGKPLLGWLTLPIIAISFSILLTMQ